jgi:DNA-binding LacI/PurR family transcriptional regulator
VVTSYDVARAAGVSQATVSNAFNRPMLLSSERLAQILAVAEELGYTGPHPAGRSLRTGRVGALGVILTGSLPYAFDDPATIALLRGISEVSELAEVALTLLPCPLDSTVATDSASMVLQGAVDGFLAYAMPEGHRGLQRVVQQRRPVVVIDGPDLGRLPRVGIDEETAAARAARHLIDLGHRRLGILVDRLHPDGGGGLVSPSRAATARDLVMRRRLAGYTAAARIAGLDPSELLVVEAGGFDQHASRWAAEQLFAAGEVTAVLAASDVLALAARDVATECGWSVPDDLSVVGFDDIPAAATAGLTTIRQPLVDKGRRAARLLLDVVAAHAGGTSTSQPGDRGAGESEAAKQTPDKPEQIILPTELVVRSSTAPAGAARRGSTARTHRAR